MFGFQIAEPNEALIISGKRGKGDGAAEAQQYKIVASGDRVFVLPVLQSARRLNLDLNRATVPVNCVTQQGIPVRIVGVVAFKVGSDNDSIANAAQRFLQRPETMEERVHEIFAGHIRGIVGSLTIEDLIRDREALTSKALEATADDMGKMGLSIDTLQIAEIDDPTGYIENLSKPDIARVQMESRIAQAQRDREAAEAEQENTALVAAARRDSEIKQAQLNAEVQEAQAKAAQAGPLAEAEARKDVVSRETEVAQLRALQREQDLVSEVQKPAEADRKRREIEAEADKVTAVRKAEADAESRRVRAIADAEATEKTGTAEAKANEAKGTAEATVIAAKGEAEGKALEARAQGLASESEAVIAQMLAERAPQMVEAAAKAFDNVDQMTVLNGAEGVTDAMVSIMSTASRAFNAARGELDSGQVANNGTKVPVA